MIYLSFIGGICDWFQKRSFNYIYKLKDIILYNQNFNFSW